VVPGDGEPLWTACVGQARDCGGGGAGYGSPEKMEMGLTREAADPAPRRGCVCAMARAWETGAEKGVKDLVTHLPRKYYQRVQVPRLPGSRGSPFNMTIFVQ